MALALVMAMAPLGCARIGASQPSAASNAPSADRDAGLKFSQCMRDQGLTWFPDPQADGRMSVSAPEGVTKETMDAAHEACKQFMPDGGEARQPSAEELEKVRQMAKCMRANGVPNFPDPSPEGQLSIDSSKLGTGPGDPTWDKAEKACAQYLPKGARTEKHGSGIGVGGGAG
ncbi:hypothetical protein [Paractinoplanes rishiriensis]|uniref:hypothetical protein n=1 Tax=Paractinoplanes rishiriensis TaxID=1050105 RepID=UPI00194254F4|nr:hypothetical protein [Actinoplanes rishiriensis]